MRAGAGAAAGTSGRRADRTAGRHAVTRDRRNYPGPLQPAQLTRAAGAVYRANDPGAIPYYYTAREAVRLYGIESHYNDKK